MRTPRFPFVESLPASWSRLYLLIFLVSCFACSLPPTRAKVPPVPGAEPGASQTGIASWYGPGFHGRPTASGVIYDQGELTAAHQTLPLGTKVMVTNLNNGKSTEVSINDRGPFAKGRIIDLSYAAARSLGMIGPGTIPVRVEVMDGPYKLRAIPQSLNYTLQIGSFVDKGNAEKLREQLKKIYPEPDEVSVVPVHGKDTVYYRVQLGSFTNHHEAETHGQKLARKGFPVVIMEK